MVNLSELGHFLYKAKLKHRFSLQFALKLLMNVTVIIFFSGCFCVRKEQGLILYVKIKQWFSLSC